jgi:cytochrome c5
MNLLHTLSTKVLPLTSGALLLGLCASNAALAQNPPAEQNPPMTKPGAEKQGEPYAAISRMVGAPVYLLASEEKVAEAKRDGEAVDRPKAKVQEWLIDRRDGTMAHAVVSLGGFLGIGDKVVLVPAKELTWNQSMERYDLGWTKAQLESQRAFDLDAATKSGLDAACGIPANVTEAEASAAKKAIADASAKGEARAVGSTFRPADCCLCKASEMAKLPVYAGSADWGKVQDLFVDRASGKVVLAVVNHGSTLGVGGTDYLVPFSQCTVARQKDSEDRLLCTEKCTPTNLENCVKFEKPKNGVVDPAAAKQALEQKMTKS